MEAVIFCMTLDTDLTFHNELNQFGDFHKFLITKHKCSQNRKYI